MEQSLDRPIFGADGFAALAAVGHEQLLGVLMDSMPIVLWAIDVDGVFTFHDGKGLDSAGLKPGQFLGSNLFDIYPAPATEEVRRALAGERVHSFSRAHDIDWESWMVPIRGDGGEVVSVAGFTIDVTRARQAERELRSQLELVQKQQEVIRSLSAPIIEVWDEVLTLPMVGVLDSARAASVMEELLSAIVQTGARYAILDLTGVEVVDTRVAAHLISLVSAIRLVGAEGIIAGIRPTVAQTMVALGLDLSSVITRANLKAALKHCLQRLSPRAQ